MHDCPEQTLERLYDNNRCIVSVQTVSEKRERVELTVTYAFKIFNKTDRAASKNDDPPAYNNYISVATTFREENFHVGFHN